MVGDYVANIIVNQLMILELKSCQGIIRTHEIQLVNYLTATKKTILHPSKDPCLFSPILYLNKFFLRTFTQSVRQVRV